MYNICNIYCKIYTILHSLFLTCSEYMYAYTTHYTYTLRIICCIACYACIWYVYKYGCVIYGVCLYYVYLMIYIICNLWIIQYSIYIWYYSYTLYSILYHTVVKYTILYDAKLIIYTLLCYTIYRVSARSKAKTLNNMPRSPKYCF